MSHSLIHSLTPHIDRTVWLSCSLQSPGPEQKWSHLGGAALSPGGPRAPQTLPVALSGSFFLPSTKDELNSNPTRPLWESHEPVVS